MPQDKQTEEADNERAELDKWIASKIGDELYRHYPRLQWGIMVDSIGQTIIIVCPFVSQTSGYYLHMNKYTIHELQKRAVHAAGEILERHGISRDQTINVENIQSMARDLKGSVIAPDGKPEPIHKCH